MFNVLQDIPRYSMIHEYTQRPSKADQDYMIFHAIPRYALICHEIWTQRPSKADRDYIVFHAIPWYSSIFHDTQVCAATFQGRPWLPDIQRYSMIFVNIPRYSQIPHNSRDNRQCSLGSSQGGICFQKTLEKVYSTYEKNNIECTLGCFWGGICCQEVLEQVCSTYEKEQKI